MDDSNVESNCDGASIDMVYQDAMDELKRRWEQKVEEKSTRLEAIFKQNPTWMKYLPDYGRIIKEDYAEAIMKGCIIRSSEAVQQSEMVYFYPKTSHYNDQTFRDGFECYCGIQGYRVWFTLTLDHKNGTVHTWEIKMRKDDMSIWFRGSG